MTTSERHYVSYLVRMWRAGGDDARAWRAAVESAQTGEKEAFANLDELFVFLRDEARDDPADKPH